MPPEPNGPARLEIHREPLQRSEIIGLILILALAGVLRLGWPGIQEFKRDEAALLSLSLDLAEGVSFPLRGIGSSVGVPNSPVSVYLYAIPMLAPWNRTPARAGSFAGELGVLAVCLTWFVARRYWGRRAALLAALMFAASPWAAIYTRKVWAQNLIPLFTLAWMASGLLAFAEGRKRWIAAHLLLLAVLLQIHLSGLALVPVTLLALVLYRSRLDLRWLSAGAGLGLASFLPIAVYALGPGQNALGQLRALADRPAEWSFDSLRFAWLTSVGAEVHSLAGPQAYQAFLASSGWLTLTPWILTIVLGLGLVLWLVRLRSGWAAPEILTGLWLAFPILIFARHSTPVYPHYFIVLYPAVFIAAGVGLSAAADRIGRAGLGRGLTAGVTLLALAQGLWLIRLLFFLNSHWTPGGFGTPVGMLESLAASIRRESARLEETLVVSGGDAAELDESPAVMSVLLRGLPVRYVDGDEASVWPARPSLVVVWPGTRASERDYEGWGEVVGSSPLRPGEGAVELRRIDRPPSDLSALMPVPSPRILANRVELDGYAWEAGTRPGETGLWRLAWRAPQPDGDYHFFNHLLAGDGSKIAGADGAGLAVRSWREGDLVMSYFPFELPGSLPEPPFAMRVGMYEYPSLIGVPVLDEAANPLADAVLLGPIPVNEEMIPK